MVVAVYEVARLTDGGTAPADAGPCELPKSHTLRPLRQAPRGDVFEVGAIDVLQADLGRDLSGAVPYSCRVGAPRVPREPGAAKAGTHVTFRLGVLPSTLTGPARSPSRVGPDRGHGGSEFATTTRAQGRDEGGPQRDPDLVVGVYWSNSAWL